jgi:hypothetical protein
VKAAATASAVLERRLEKTMLKAPADGVVSVIVAEIRETIRRPAGARDRVCNWQAERAWALMTATHCPASPRSAGRCEEAQLFAKDQVGARSQQLRYCMYRSISFVQDQRDSALASSCARAKQESRVGFRSQSTQERDACRDSRAGSHSVAQRLQTFRTPYVTRSSR